MTSVDRSAREPTSSLPFAITVDVRGPYVRLVLSGELDGAAGEELSAHVVAIARVPSVITIELDAEAVRFIDSGGVAALERCRRQALRHGAECFLGPVSPPVRRVVACTGLGSALHDPRAN